MLHTSDAGATGGHVLFPLALLLTLGSPAQAPAELSLPPWNVQCTHDGKKCLLELLVPFGREGKPGLGGLAVAYDNLAGKPVYITVLIPADADGKGEVLVHLMDTVPDGNSWKLEAAGPGFMSLPVMDCNKQFCMARVRPEIDNGDGTTTDLFVELNKRHLLWVAFKRHGKPERFMVPVSGFPAALEQALATPLEAAPAPPATDNANTHR